MLFNPSEFAIFLPLALSVYFLLNHRELILQSGSMDFSRFAKYTASGADALSPHLAQLVEQKRTSRRSRQ